ncbi:MAG: hypothetical protein SGILL_008180 [Bacillariaceae sp.]
MKFSTYALSSLAVAALTSTASAGMVVTKEKTVSAMITITNMAPEMGTFQTPVWAGIHDGSFDLYDRNKTVTVAIERMAEDGDLSLLFNDFANTEGGAWDGMVGGAPISPGETVTLPFDITYTTGCSHYFSYGSMILPSNDFWIANGNPMAYEVINDMGDFIGTEFMVFGDQVLDAGTEVNDEDPANTAFFGQAEADSGVNENSYVTLATEGFKPAGSGGILDDEMFANADFTAEGYMMLKVKVEAVNPEMEMEVEPTSSTGDYGDRRRASVRGAN